MLQILKSQAVPIKTKPINNNVFTKIEELKQLGLETQARNLSIEHKVRCKIARISEFNMYKVIPIGKVIEFRDKLESSKLGNESYRFWSSLGIWGATIGIFTLIFAQLIEKEVIRNNVGVGAFTIGLLGIVLLVRAGIMFKPPKSLVIKEAKSYEKMIPDSVVENYKFAYKNGLFDSYSIMSIEAVKDPLLVGQITGCPDYFLIDEWGDDVSYDDIMK